MTVAYVRKKDRVRLLSGKDRGKEGTVIDVDRARGRVLVAKLNVIKKHAKGTRETPAGIREKEAYMPLSRVMLVCPKCGRATRAKAGALSDGTKARVCRRCGEMVG